MNKKKFRDSFKKAIPGKVALSKRPDGTAVLYATSRGPMRVVVPLAETTVEVGEVLCEMITSLQESDKQLCGKMFEDGSKCQRPNGHKGMHEVLLFKE